jgi:hypothetical protein
MLKSAVGVGQSESTARGIEMTWNPEVRLAAMRSYREMHVTPTNGADASAEEGPRRTGVDP